MITRIAAVCGIVTLLCVAAVAQAPQPPPRTIMVTGTAERMVTPDTALIVLAVETQAPTVAVAVQENNTITNRVMEAIRGLNIPRLTISTLGFDVQPIYEQLPTTPPPTRPARIVGYRVINRLRVRIPQPDPQQLSTAIGRVLEAAIAAGANRVENIDFQLDAEQPVVLELIGEATRNARATAEALARAADVQVGPVLSLTTSPIIQPPQPFFTRAEAVQAGVPIVVGPLTVRVMVSVVYEIR